MSALGVQTLPERFMSKVRVTESTDCWEWTSTIDRHGYGSFYWKGLTRRAHRVAYEVSVGAIPDGLHLDHLCRNTRCVNPEHLEPVTHAENMRRRAMAITHCRSGHPLTPANTYVDAASKRHCRACQREAVARYRARKAALRGRTQVAS